MDRGARLSVSLIGGLLFALGLGTSNYTTEAKAPAHREWAQESGFPEPSVTLFHAGLVSQIVGVGLIVLGVRRRREA